MTIAALVPSAAIVLASAEPPLDPDDGTARDWLQQELSKGEYVSAQPTLWDRISQAFFDWLNSLFQDTGTVGFDPTGLIVVLVVVVAIVVLAILVGRPALARRSAESNVRRVFEGDDARSAAELRAASEAAARDRDWALAVSERFRAIARALGDRTLVAVRPGSTAHEIARRASVPFPAELEALELAARDFDDVRYLDRDGSEAAWQRTRDLDSRLESARPARIDAFERVGA